MWRTEYIEGLRNDARADRSRREERSELRFKLTEVVEILQNLVDDVQDTLERTDEMGVDTADAD